MTLKILTLNVWHDAGPWAQRLTLIHRWIDSLDPDLIGFQEVLRGPGRDQLAELLGERGYHGAHAAAQKFWSDPQLGFGNAVASRWPIAEQRVLNLPDRGDIEKRVALTVEVAAPFGPVVFCCTHLHYRLHHGDTRKAQVRALADHLVSSRPRGGFPPIVVGDFNAEPDSDEIRFMCGLTTIDGKAVHFRDAWRVVQARRGTHAPGYTWSNDNAHARGGHEPDRRLDYVFVGYPSPEGHGRVLDCRLVCNEPEGGVWPSDHIGVYAELDSSAPRS